MFNRRKFLSVVSSLPMAMFIKSAYSNSFPHSNIEIIVPLQAGGSADTGVRAIANVLQKKIQTPIIVHNKPGGSFVIGMQNLKSSRPDGHTLIAVNTGMSAAQATLNNINLLDDLSFISTYGKTPVLFCVPINSRFTSINDLISYAQAHPNELNFGSVGTGGLEHLWTTMLGLKTDSEFTHIPYKGMPDAMLALAKGDLDFVPCVVPMALPFLQKGTIKTFGIISDARSQEMPDIPTLREQNIDVIPMEFWSGFAAPKKTPINILEKIKIHIIETMQDQEIIKIMKNRGTKITVSSSQNDYEKIIKNEIKWMKDVVKNANIKIL